ncbi:MAG: GNAT family N-acetyltransferase [Bacteroidota bacterium]|nr:GNAT family N-acetyltransferase [Bacteroidota bacterium]
MIRLVRTNPADTDFRQLVALLDKDLRDRYGDQQSFFDQFNKLDTIQYAVVAYNDAAPVGCGALRAFKENMVEVKRMYVETAFRGQGIGGMILRELESWAKDLNFYACVLETGMKQPEAIRLYQKKGYMAIPNYGQYQDVDDSVCMKKIV